MYAKIERAFLGFPSRKTVVEAMLKYGLRVDGKGKVYCADIEMPPAKIARALGVDRRVVIETAKHISKNGELYEIFSALRPTAFIAGSARKLGFEVLEIEAEPHEKGIVKEIATLIADAGIAIRQIVADDPDMYPNPKLTIVLEKALPGNLIDKLKKSKKIRRISFE